MEDKWTTHWTNEEGKLVKGQKDIADTQMEYYRDKIRKVKAELPQVNTDPMRTLKEAFDNWDPSNRPTEFRLKEVTNNTDTTIEIH